VLIFFIFQKYGFYAIIAICVPNFGRRDA